MKPWERMEEELNDLQAKHFYRNTELFNSSKIFSSNDYLDLNHDERLKKSAIKTIKKFGTGTGGARLTTGNTIIHKELESTIAKFKQRESALVFNTGYMANIGTITALTKKGDVIYSDAFNHASIIDGCRLSEAEIVIYQHNDMKDLEAKIKEHSGKPGLIVSDGVFSMDGDIVKLPELVFLAKEYELLTMIDDAHATGVIGKTGKGTEEYYGMENSVDVLMGTLSKAIGAEGGFVCGNQLLIRYLTNKARSFIFSTALPPADMAAAQCGIEIIMNEPERIQKLQKNIRYFCNALNKNGIKTKSESAIIPIIIGDEAKALAIMAQLKKQDFYVSAIRYPTVPKGKARLRITMKATHSFEELDHLADALSVCLI